jgi:hypothetical protein
LDHLKPAFSKEVNYIFGPSKNPQVLITPSMIYTVLFFRICFQVLKHVDELNIYDALAVVDNGIAIPQLWLKP